MVSGLSESNLFFQNIPLRDIESVRVLPSALAGVRYGTGSGWGVIRVESRRPGNRSDDEAPVAPPSVKSYDWDLEPGGHPWLRVLGGATAGSLAGLAIALGTSGDCSPLNETRNEDCSGRGVLTAGIQTFTLPVVGGALGANLLGRTEWSRGKFALSTLVTFTPMFMGYFFADATGPFGLVQGTGDVRAGRGCRGCADRGNPCGSGLPEDPGYTEILAIVPW